MDRKEMNPIKCIISYLMMLISSVHEAKGQSDKAFAITKQAKVINPKSKTALYFLCDYYYRSKQYEESKQILTDALSIYPDDQLLNQLMVMNLFEKGEPIEKAIPYIRIYLKSRMDFKNKNQIEGKAPIFLKIRKIFHNDFNPDSFWKNAVDKDYEWAKWAQKILNDYEKNSQSI